MFLEETLVLSPKKEWRFVVPGASQLYISVPLYPHMRKLWLNPGAAKVALIHRR